MNEHPLPHSPGQKKSLCLIIFGFPSFSIHARTHLRVISRTMNKRDEHLSLLAASSLTVVAHGGHAGLVALFDELEVDSGASDALLEGSLRFVIPSPLAGIFTPLL
jgi:hypothetical protein